MASGANEKGPETPRSQAKLAKSKYRFSSTQYYKYLYEQSLDIVKSGYQRGIKLEDIPGLLEMNKVRLKDIRKKNTRITKVHGSMEG